MSNNKNTSNANSGIGFWGALQLIFIALKLCGVIKWGWLWVLSPIWIGTIICVIVIIIYIWLLH